MQKDALPGAIPRHFQSLHFNSCTVLKLISILTREIYKVIDKIRVIVLNILLGGSENSYRRNELLLKRAKMAEGAIKVPN